MIEWLMADAGVNNLFLCGFVAILAFSAFIAHRAINAAERWQGLYTGIITAVVGTARALKEGEEND